MVKAILSPGSKKAPSNKVYFSPHVLLSARIIAMKIVVSGMGYVGFSLLTLLGKDNDVTAIDPNKEKIRLLENGCSPLSGEPFSIGQHIHPTTEIEAYKGQELAFVAVPTDYNEATKRLNTSVVDEVVGEIVKRSPDALIVIKSTVPIGYTLDARKRFSHSRIVFCPEFLRESSYLEDVSRPSRIVIGAEETEKETANELSQFLLRYVPASTKVLHVSTGEAESIKLLSNAYLSLRVAFFNEVDNLSSERGYLTKNIIDGMSMDPRIGDYYNNPSFGFGGYCLPKDEKEAASSFLDEKAGCLFASIDKSNETRKDLIAEQIIKKGQGKTIGFYHIGKSNGKNSIRPTVTFDILLRVLAKHKDILIYEPSLKLETFHGVEVVASEDEFKKRSSIIVVDKIKKDLFDVKEKIFSSDQNQKLIL